MDKTIQKDGKIFLACDACGQKAVWCFLPGNNSGDNYCENCVPRGCSCNLLPVDGNEDNLDEYMYNEDGWEVKNE